MEYVDVVECLFWHETCHYGICGCSGVPILVRLATMEYVDVVECLFW